MSSTSTNGKPNKKPRIAGSSVRFLEDAQIVNGGGGGCEGKNETGVDVAAAQVASHRRPKRPRPDRPNPDELDDIDDYVPQESDEEDYNIPGENETLQAKRKRRLKHAGDEMDDDEWQTDSTHIDQETSLASEGIPIEPFHMQEENNDGTGYFDGDTYVFRRAGGVGVGEEPDAWLDNLENEGDEELIQTTTFRNNSRNSENEEISMSEKMDFWSKEELYAKLLPLVSDTETLSQAIVRYGNLMKQKTDDSNSRDLAKKALNDLTEAASALLLKGDVSIYQQTRSDIAKLLPDNDNNSNVNKPKTPVQWEYQGNHDGEIHGPYTTEQMQGWIQQGYFVGPAAVHVRTVVDAAPSIIRDDLLSDLLEDDEDESKPLSKLRGEWTMSDQVDFQQYI